MRDLSHGSQVVLGIPDVLEALGVVRLDASLHEGLERLLVLVPLVKLRRGRSLGLLGSSGRSLWRRLGRLPGAGLLLAGRLVLDLILPLPAPGGRGAGRRRGSWLRGSAVVVVDPPHVVSQIPLARETMAGNRALTPFIGAQVRLLAVAVHGVGLTLMPKEAGSRGKAGILATLNLAAVGLEVRVDEFAAMAVVVS